MARRKALCHVGIRMRMKITTNITMRMRTTMNMSICMKSRIAMAATRTTTHTITSMMRITMRIMAWQRSAV